MSVVYEHKTKHDEAAKAFAAGNDLYVSAMLMWDEHDGSPAPSPPAEPPAYSPCDILEFWRAHKDAFPIIAQIARWLLVISISSAEVERLFSRGGLVLTSRRNRLGHEKEELFLLTAYNMTREWKEGGATAGTEEGIMMRRLFAGCVGGLEFDDAVE